ncbi:septation protein SpoVG family protein [Aporhodopirellula aestuarii]|uniref:Septation protein SpoVG family protein n=1 Tax=Aporhodopirellula aestuarii TaxID=2950107 RepID=A0ABT0U778_9BACT|nr:septation protein SpoVG family protein [Aporhodopirellula aestuarii]MCM2372808.1 septation protein SpoVG family protein [Aporhodopirellula aestuarii]
MVVEITEIRIKLMEGSEDRLRAFCSITIDQSFVVRDLKIIDGTHGPFVAMPSRKLTGHCNRCGSKNHLRASFCNQCGAKLVGSGTIDSPQKLYADVAHPINSECREMIQNAVIEEFNAELQRSAQPNYRSRYDDDFDAGDYDEADYLDTQPSASTSNANVQRTSKDTTVVARANRTSAVQSTIPPQDESEPSINDSFGAGLFDTEPEEATDETEVSETDVPENVVAADETPAEGVTSSDEPMSARADEPQTLQTPHFASDSKADRQESGQASNERTDNAESDPKMMRAEVGVRNTIPRPHFSDRQGGPSRQTIASGPSSGDTGSAEPISEPDGPDEPLNPGFGAGILDD